MQKRPLGNSDLSITPLGIGAWAIGGPWTFGWGPQDDNESVAAIHAGLDAGLNWLDTAPIYGYGHSEAIVARALKGRTRRPYVFTKCERVWNDERAIQGVLKADSLRRECEASLRRLQVDVIDLYQIHWPEPDVDVEEGWSTLAALQKEGKVRWIGVSNFNRSQLERAAAVAPITSLQPPYSLPSPEIEDEVLPWCQQHNTGVIVYSPMKSGLLSGSMTRERIAKLPEDDFRKRSKSFQEPWLTANLGLVELLRTIGQRHELTPGAVAIAWTLRHPAVTGAIVGLRRPDQVAGVVGAATFRLSKDEMAEIDAYQSKHRVPLNSPRG